jgi:UDP-N-acetylmuramate dehydrogenase
MIKHNEHMAQYCTLKMGGHVKTLFEPESVEELKSFLAESNDQIIFLGLGSNVLFREGIFQGTVIRLTKLKNINVISKNRIFAEAGASLAKISRTALKNNFFGAEFFIGIPGTLGGGLAMNAGAFGGETWDLVEEILTIDLNGVTHKRGPKDFSIGYRSVRALNPNEFFIGATLLINKKNTNTIKNLLEKRNSSQPIGEASCGSVFINPENMYAAELIEQSGLKDFCIGDVCVSNIHANYIINKGNGSPSDAEDLIKHIKETILKNTGIELQTEVKIL